MKDSLKKAILSCTQASDAKLIKVIQELWSGYGFIARIELNDSHESTVIVKDIELPEHNKHPRGWNTSASHERKIKSYEVEIEWYKSYSAFCDESCRVAKYLTSTQDQKNTFIVLEDLDTAGYPIRKARLDKEEAKTCLTWLANFHATFLNKSPKNIWPIGSYWHLATRKDEFNAMADGILKQSAKQIDKLLNNCHYQTIIHGDAKIANFCFSEDGKNVAAVDFQYVGGGCGMKDIAYFLGSCLNENQCKIWEDELLEAYFSALKHAIEARGIDINFKVLENEWRQLYPIAWTDFTRFLLGWMPTHDKLNGYSQEMVNRVLNSIF